MSYNVHLNLQDTHNSRCNAPSIDDQALFFYVRLPENSFSLLGIDRHGNPTNYTITSRQLVTNSLDPNNIKWSHLGQGTGNVLTCEPPDNSTTIVTEVATESGRTTSPNVRTTVPEMTTTITTTKVSPTAVLEGIRLAVVDSRGLSSQLQAQILVCTSTLNMYIYISHTKVTVASFSFVHRCLIPFRCCNN